MSYDNRNVPRLWFHHAEEKIGGGNVGTMYGHYGTLTDFESNEQR
jgi:hypothetical protein